MPQPEVLKHFIFKEQVFYFAAKISPLLVNTYHHITITLSLSPYHNFYVRSFQPPLPIKISIFKYFTSKFLFYFSHSDISYFGCPHLCHTYGIILGVDTFRHP
jgi:hypothetical protein